MEQKGKKHIPNWLQRTIYMLLALVASVILLKHPVFSFQEDKGIIYVRSFSMDEKTFYVTQTELKTQRSEVTATMSVAGLFYCAWALLVVCATTMLCFFSNRWRMRLCIIAVFIAGAFYLLMVFYAMQITDNHYATLYPNIIALLPAIIMQLMLLVRRNVARTIMTDNEDEEKEE